MKRPFENVVAQHGATVLRVCRAVLGPQDAEDAWSETFLAAMRAYPDLPETANVEAWLVTIAHRKAIDVLRATKRGPLPVERDAGGTNRRSGIPGAGDPDLWGAVGRLPSKQRQAVAYHYVAGLAYAEIAEILGGTVEAARRAAADGIKNLQKELSGRDQERSTIMNDLRSDDDVTALLSTPVDVDTLGRLHRRLEREAERGRSGRRRLHHHRLPGRAAAARSHTEGPGPSGLRQRGPRPSTGDPRREAQPARPAGPEAAGGGGARDRRVLRQASPELRPAAGPVAVAGVPAAGADTPAGDRLRADPQLS